MNLDYLELPYGFFADEKESDILDFPSKFRDSKIRKQEAWDRIEADLKSYCKEFGNIILLDVNGDEFANLIFNNSASIGELSTSYDY